MPGHDSRRYTVTEIKAGIMFFLSLVILLFVVFAIQGIRPGVKLVEYYACFRDIGGLNLGAPVRFGGFKIGRVSDIKIDENDSTRIRVTFKVPPDVPIKKDSQAYISQVSLTSEKHLEITTGSADAPLLPIGSEVSSTRKDIFGMAGEVGEKVGEVLDQVKEVIGTQKATHEGEMVSIVALLKNVDEAVSDLREVLEENRPDVKEMLKRLPDLEEQVEQVVFGLREILEENKDDFRKTVQKTHELVSTGKEATDKLDKTVAHILEVAMRLSDFADQLESILQNADVASTEVRELLQENRATVEALLHDMREAAYFAKEFTREIMEQPQSLIRGVKREGR